MREYIDNSVRNTTKHFNQGGIEVIENDPIPDSINLNSILKAIENNLPSHYFKNLEAIVVEHLEEFDQRGVNALYRDNKLYITNQQQNSQDLIDDIVHELAHHLEVLFPEEIYSDVSLINEFLKKRNQLKFELQTEGYWVNEYDFDKLKFDSEFDDFLYQRVGRNMLKMVTTGLFIRPYAAVSLREYFATGFEAYYLGKQDSLEKISPMLYDKINELHHSTDY